MRQAIASLFAIFAAAAHGQSAAPQPTEFQTLMQRCLADRGATVHECGRVVSDLLGHTRVDVSDVLGLSSNGGNDPTEGYEADCKVLDPDHITCDIYYCGVNGQQSFCDFHLTLQLHLDD